MPQVTKAHHTGLQVASIERSVALYSRRARFRGSFPVEPLASYIEKLVGYPNVISMRSS